MRATLIINFDKINNQKIPPLNESLGKKLIKETENTIATLTDKLKDYFKSNKIETTITYNVE